MQKFRKVIQFIFLAPLFIVPILNLLEIYFMKGTYISLDVGGLSISDPVSVLQALFLSHHVAPIMLVSVAIPALIVIFFGRVWCSWACPYYLMLDGFEALRKKLKLKSLKKPYKKDIHYKSKHIKAWNINTWAYICRYYWCTTSLFNFATFYYELSKRIINKICLCNC